VGAVATQPIGKAALRKANGKLHPPSQTKHKPSPQNPFTMKERNEPQMDVIFE
jgi:hypothetical protein